MTNDLKKRIEPGNGYENMVSTLLKAGIQPPFVPDALRLSVDAKEEWCWSTAQGNSFHMYGMNYQYLHDLMTEDASDYMALSHGGHGINSYGLQYALRYGPLVIFFQSSFGGAYSNEKKDICRINSGFNQISALVETIPADIPNKRYNKRVALLWSDFREVCRYCTLNLSTLQRREEAFNLFSDVVDWKHIPEQDRLFGKVKTELVTLIKTDKESK